MHQKQLEEAFVSLYGSTQYAVFHSPGRVNLIGEHTDYNGGYVFPAALTLGTYAVVARRRDSLLRFASTKFDSKPIEVDLAHVHFHKEYEWVNYLLGVVAEFQSLGVPLGGLDILLHGNLPSNAGLSSSASIALLMSVILNTLFSAAISTIELVKLSQRSENNFVGVSCGIMDQFAVGFGRKDQAMLLDCNTLSYQYIPIALTSHSLVISNTNSPRRLSSSKYNERRRECEQAAKDLGVSLLCTLTAAQFEANAHKITCPIARKRATHAVLENERTKEAAKQLAGGNLAAFGNLMNESHTSLRDLYEVTGTALDTLAEAAWSTPGVLGSRMTGAGFGGCTVSLVENEHIDNFIARVREIYQDKTGQSASFYVANIGDGAKRVS